MEHGFISKKPPLYYSLIDFVLKKAPDPPIVSKKAPPYPPIVSIESPYFSANPFVTLRNYQYAVLAFKHEASLGNIPFASHITYTQWVLGGLNSHAGDAFSEIVHRSFKTGAAAQVLGRKECIEQSNSIRRKCDALIVYDDFGHDQSTGVKDAITLAQSHGILVKYKRLPEPLLNQVFGQTVLSTVLPLAMMALPVVGAAATGRFFSRVATRAFRKWKKKGHPFSFKNMHTSQ
jgi:hypothetical protein